MLDYRLTFDQPLYLWLLTLLPCLWLWGRRSLAAMGGLRRAATYALRTAVYAALVLALAEVNIVKASDRLAVIYLLDASSSISPEQSKEAIRYINESRAAQQGRRPRDTAGVIVFGREAAVELPLWESDVPLSGIESQVDAGATNLAGALRLARACFPHDASKRVVILSDGNENVDSAAREAGLLAEGEIGIDVVPILRRKVGDVAIEKVSAPADVRRGLPFDVKVVVANSRSTTDETWGAISGRLQVTRRAGSHEDLVADQPVEIRPGKQPFSFREELDSSDFYAYDVRFVPDGGPDTIPQNNVATAFTQVTGRGRALLVEDWMHPGEFQGLVDVLRAAQLEVDVVPSSQMYGSLAELQRYDTVILADVPRTSGEEASDLAGISDEQVDTLVRNTQQMGCGLVMLGGPNSFGAGGWTNTSLEEAMPVDFQIKNAKVMPSGALMLVIDHSGSMGGGKLEMSKAAAIAAVKVLGPRDFIGVVGFDSVATWVVPIGQVDNGARATSRISRLGAGGGTNMMPGMQEGYRALQGVATSIKHMIVLTDGHTETAEFQTLTAAMRKQGITTTCVAVGEDSDAALMKSIALVGGGKFYKVEKPTTIPRIFMKEAMRVARPLVYESQQPFQPRLEIAHEMLGGVGGSLPPISGYVMTTVKDNPLVEVSISSPNPPSVTPHALLASWTYGLGRTVAFTTDAGQRWAKTWPAWDSYDKIFTQMIRWSMRPTADDGKVNVFAEARDGKLHVVVTALDTDDAFLNFLTMHASVVDPTSKPIDLAIEQVAPGRYVGTCPAEKPGPYFITVAPGQGIAPRRVGVNVGYSPEYLDLVANEVLLNNLAHKAPRHGPPGEVIRGIDPEPGGKPIDVFRHDLPAAASRQGVWPWMVLAAACLFFCDVFNRRVVLSLAPAFAIAHRIAASWRRGELATAEPAIDRLRQRKKEVAREIDDRRGAARFEAAAPFVDSPPVDVEVETSSVAATASRAAPAIAPEEAEASYTSRLLRAKRDVWRK